VFFFTPVGIIGIIASVRANRRAASGDIDGALRASRTAKTYCWVSLVLGLGVYLLVAAGVIHLPNSP
jgi:Interferon-induced transmembrane protein